MKIFQVKNVNIPENWSNKVNNKGILEYYTEETGCKKTKNFSFIEVEFPENPSWLEIVKINIQYGEIVALEFANHKVAGIVARSYLNAKTQMYLKSKEHWDKMDSDFANKMFEKFAIHDYFLGICGIGSLDVTKLDELLSKDDKEYNPLTCQYQGRETSQKEYLASKYGEDFALAMEAMI